MFFAAGDGDIAGYSGMLFACWAILVLMVLMSITFLRARRREYAIAIMPLCITPAVYIFSGILSRVVDPIVAFSSIEIRILINIAAGLIACLLLGISSRGIAGKRSRNAFFAGCSLFVVVLSLVLIGRMI